MTKDGIQDFDRSKKLEWIVTNGMGCYSSSTVLGMNPRKYHGLLVTPVEHLDGNRHVLLSAFDETIVENKSEFNLGIERFVQGGENFQLAQCQRMTNGREQRHDADQHPS